MPFIGFNFNMAEIASVKIHQLTLFSIAVEHFFHSRSEWRIPKQQIAAKHSSLASVSMSLISQSVAA